MERNRQEEYRALVVRQMADLMRRQRAPWQMPDRADLPVPRAPFNGAAEGSRVFRGANALWLAACSARRGWTDPRFVTAEQAEASGWEIEAERAVHLQFWRRPVGNERESLIFRVYNAAAVKGMPELAPRITSEPQALIDRLASGTSTDVAAERQRAGVSAAARSAAQQLIDELDVGADDALRALHVDIAAFLYARELGLRFEPRMHAQSVLPLTTRLQVEPEAYFRVARDAQRLASKMVELSVAQEIEQAVVATAATVETASVYARDRHDKVPPDAREEARASTTAAKAIEPGTRVFLAVPWKDRARASALGAEFDEDLKAWWISTTVDKKPFQEWAVSSSQVFNFNDVFADFEQEMAAFGLVPDSLTVEKCGKWQYVPTTASKGKRKNGAYVLNMDGIPHGYIKNFLSGQEGPWRYDGARLSPEQRAAMAAQAREQAMLREREVLQEYIEVGGKTEDAFNRLSAAGADEHGYCTRKGVGAHGVRIARAGKDDLSGLLNMDDFRGGKETYLVVPGRDVAGRLWTVQTIPERSNGTKFFTRDGRKKGAFHIIGAENVAELATASAVLFGEGYATCGSIHDATKLFVATGLPVVVGFDAGNLVEVVKQVSAQLHPKQPKIVCADNDQFFVEKALSAIDDMFVDEAEAQLVTKGLAAHGQLIRIASGTNGEAREIRLGGIRADGHWHEGRLGKYRLELEERNGLVRGVTASVALHKEPEKMKRMIFRNTGVEAASEAARAVGGVLAIPEFASLADRPTDFNDLSLSEGRERVAQLIGAKLGMELRLAPASVRIEAPRSALGVKR